MEIIVGKTAGFCYGVKRAVDGAKKELKKNEKIFGLGEIVHNKDVVKNLEKEGMQFIENIKDAKGKTIVRAHGIPKEIYEQAQKNKIELIDYTCPKVLKIHELAKKYANEGYYIFLLGTKKHPENIGTLSYCGKNTFVIEKEDDAIKAIDKFEKTKIKKLFVIAQTTYSLEKFYIIQEIIRNEINIDVKLVINNTICQATEIRQDETEEISKKVDDMIIIGGKNSSNTRKLYDISKKNCELALWVENANELDISIIKDCNKIGVMAGASTPKEIIDEVEEKITKFDMFLLQKNIAKDLSKNAVESIKN